MAEKPSGDVFQQAADRRIEKFTESVSFDRRIYAHDIRGSMADAQMPAKVGPASDDECQQFEQGQGDVRQEIGQGQFTFDIAPEDIDMQVKTTLVA